MKNLVCKILRLLELAAIMISSLLLPYGVGYGATFFIAGGATNLVKYRHLNISKRRFSLDMIKEVSNMGEEYRDSNRWDSLIYKYRLRHLKWVLVEFLWFFILILLLIKAGHLSSLPVVLLGTAFIKLQDIQGVVELKTAQRQIREYFRKMREVKNNSC